MHTSLLAVVLLFALESSLHLQASSLKSDNCWLSGYNLSTLNAADYWTIRLHDIKDCMLPSNTTEDELESCDLFISTCKPLGNSICPNFPNSTTCQKVVTTTGQSYYYDMGTYSSKLEFEPLNVNSSTGFQAARDAANVTDSEDCNAVVSTGLYFFCDLEASWNPDQPNVTRNVVVAQQFLSSPCKYLIQFRYDGACYTAPTLSPSHCSVQDYDTATISSREYWTATVDASACYGSDDISCVMFLAFCHPVPPEIGESCYNSAICQKGYDQDGNVLELSMGTFTNYTHFYENDEQGENGGFRMKVENGSKPDNGTVCKNGLQTEVIMVCDKSKEWNSQDISEFVQLVYHHGDDPCMYILKIGYSGACSTDAGTITAKVSPVGWIFIGLFAFAVFSYLVVGSAIMYFVKGERGLKILPHYDLWKNFFTLIAEGFRYFLDVITCFRYDGKKVHVPARVRQQPDYDKI